MKRKNYFILMFALLAVVAVSSAYSKITFKPLKKEKVEETGPKQDPRLVYRFFDEDYISGGYAYWYPDNSKVFILKNQVKMVRLLYSLIWMQTIILVDRFACTICFMI